MVKAKYAIIDWTNKEQKDISSIRNRQSDAKKLAEETGVKKLPFYSEIDTRDIASIGKNINTAKTLLSDSDSMKCLTQDSEFDFDLSLEVDTEKIQGLLTKETITSDNSKMLLVVKKPDYLGSSKWDLKNHRSGDRRFRLAGLRFPNREIDVRPGD